MRRGTLFLISLAALVATGCSSTVHEEIKLIDGREFICAWRENPAGAIREYQCFPLAVQP